MPGWSSISRQQPRTINVRWLERAGVGLWGVDLEGAGRRKASAVVANGRVRLGWRLAHLIAQTFPALKGTLGKRYSAFPCWRSPSSLCGIAADWSLLPPPFSLLLCFCLSHFLSLSLVLVWWGASCFVLIAKVLSPPYSIVLTNNRGWATSNAQSWVLIRSAFVLRPLILPLVPGAGGGLLQDEAPAGARVPLTWAENRCLLD